MEDLESMKYADLRKLAKTVGIRANIKQEKLIVELKKYYSTCGNKNEDTDVVKSRQEKAEEKKQPLESSTDLVLSQNAPMQNQHGVCGRPLSAGKSFMGAGTEALTESDKSHALTPEIQQKTQTSSAMKSSQRWVKKVFIPTARCSMTDTSNKSPVPPFMPENGKRKQTKSALESQPPSKRQRWNLKTTASLGMSATMVDASGANVNRSTSDEVAVIELLSNPGNCSTRRSHRNTFNKVPTPNLTSEIVTCTRSSRSIFEKASTPDLNIPNIDNTLPKKVMRSSASPVVKEMHGAMDTNMTNEQMKKSLISVIDKNVQEKVKAAPQVSNIPRFVQYARKLKQSKPVTPGNKNLDKINRKNFDKVDSIDVYLETKQKCAEEMTSSVKMANTVLSEVQATVDKLKSHKTPEDFRNKFTKSRQSNVNGSTPFNPTVLHISEMNLSFGIKKPSLKTPPRQIPLPNVGSQVKNIPALPQVRKSVGSVHSEKTTTTPFKFMGVANTMMNKTVGSTRKAFDLKASLSKPLTWKPHIGKLKPLEYPSESPACLKVQTNKAKTNHTLMNREASRVKVTQKRADKKHDAHMARRQKGILL